MRDRRRAGAMGLMLAWLLAAAVLAGCTRQQQPEGGVTPKPPPKAADLESLKDSSLAGARSAMEQYLDARVSGDYARVYDLLSGDSRRALTRAEVEAFFTPYRSYRFESLGEPEPLPEDPTWVRWPVSGVQWDIRGELPLSVETWVFATRYQDGRWGVALAVPLFPRAQQAYQAFDADGVDQVADQMLIVDPWEYRGHMAKAWAWLMRQDAQRALASIQLAIWVAPPEIRPQVARMGGDVYQFHGEHGEAAGLYQFVVDEIPKYANWYTARYEADTRRFLSESLLALGDPGAARTHAVSAQVLDPFNMANHALVTSLIEP